MRTLPVIWPRVRGEVAFISIVKMTKNWLNTREDVMGSKFASGLGGKSFSAVPAADSAGHEQT
jgi:hypothetical protein